MRPQLRTSTEQRRRSSMCINSDLSSSLHDVAKRRGSNNSVGSGGQFLAVPGMSIRRSSLSTSTSALLGMAEGTRKRGSFTSTVCTGSMLCVPQDGEPRRQSLPGYMDGKNHSASDPFLDRRRSSVRPAEEYRQINDAGTRKMKIFGLIMILFLALVIGVSFLKLLH